MPVSARTNEDLPAALAPSSAMPIPAVSLKEILDNTIRSFAGTAMVTSSTDKL